MIIDNIVITLHGINSKIQIIDVGQLPAPFTYCYINGNEVDTKTKQLCDSL